jgi:uncharacterized protein (DUF1330 family)
MQNFRAVAFLTTAALVFFGNLALSADSKPKAIAVVEIFESDHQAFLKDYAPLARKALESHGARYLSRGGEVTAVEATEAPSRLTILEFDSIDKAREAFGSAEYKAARAIGDKFAKFRILAIEEVDR